MIIHIYMVELCNACNHNCLVDRSVELGYCQLDNKLYISEISNIKNEEDFFVGTYGCGAIWFSGCNMKCVYCLNEATSIYGFYKFEYSPTEFYDRINNMIINDHIQHIMFINPTMYIPFIIQVIESIKMNVSNTPKFIYNTNGYDSIDTIDKLINYIDIWLPDYKYANDDIGYNLSNVKNYHTQSLSTIQYIGSRVGFNLNIQNYIATSGMLVRHLLLPGEIDNTKQSILQLKSLNSDMVIHVLTNYAIRSGVSSNQSLSKYNRFNDDCEINEIKDFVYSNNLTNIIIK